MRLIDADALHGTITDEFNRKWLKDTIVEWRAWEIRRAIDGAQTVDAVPVVRCKDCKHYKCYYLGNGGVSRECYWWLRETTANDYCSHGARMG